MAEVKSAKQKVEEEQKRARAEQAPGLHLKEPCDGCEEKRRRKQEKVAKDNGGEK